MHFETAVEDIEEELARVAPVHDFDLGVTQHPYVALGSSQFELLLWALFNHQPRTPPIYDKVTLMVVGADEGRDVWLTKTEIPVGLVQCKLSKISAPDSIREVIKFLLFAETQPELLPHPENFHYTLAVAAEPTGATVELFDAPQAWLKQNQDKLAGYVAEVSGEYETLKVLDLNDVTDRIIERLHKLSYTLIRPHDLNDQLGGASTVRGKFFRERLVIDVDANRSMLRETLDEKLAPLLGGTDPKLVALYDSEITRAIAFMRQGRFFDGFNVGDRAKRLAQQLTTGDWAEASPAVRASALGWCVRWLLNEEQLSDKMLTQSLQLMTSEEGLVAGAFKQSRIELAKGLEALAPIDKPNRRTAALQMVSNANGAVAGLDWARQAGIDVTQLDSEGRLVLLGNQLEAECWDEALTTAIELSEADYDAAPAALCLAAHAQLAQAITAADMRSVAYRNVPFGAVEFPLDDTKLDVRRKAAALFARSAAAAVKYECNAASVVFSLYDLWLELRDPDTRDAAIARLGRHLSTSQDPTPYVPLGVSFLESLDRGAIVVALERQLALRPEASAELAMALFAVAVSQPIATGLPFFHRHKATIGKYLAPAVLAEFELTGLVELGRDEAAKELLAQITPTLDQSAAASLKRIIDQGVDTTTKQLEQEYRADPSTPKLAALVHHLGAQGYSERYFELVLRLVAVTGSSLEAERAVTLLSAHNRHDEVRQLLVELGPLVDTTIELRAARAWSLYRDGKLKDALAEVGELMAERDNSNDRGLYANLLIASGRWPDLTNLVEREWAAREERNARQLLWAAQIAAQIGSLRVRPLLDAACAKAGEDAGIYATSYMLAIQSGIEERGDAQLWFEQAVALSGEDGPMQTMSLDELVAKAPDWNKHAEETGNQLRLGQIPLAAAAKLLRRPALEFQLSAMVANSHQPDPRRRTVIPAFSGKRMNVAPGTASLALGGSSIISLAALNMLDRAIKHFQPILIPHSTLIWLFEERPRLRFHQPALVKAAHRLRRALAAKRLKPFSPTVAADPQLIDTVGAPLAPMLATALAAHDEARQILVIRSAPVYKIGSLKHEQADLSGYGQYLCSCLGLVDRLRELGQLTGQEHEAATSYLLRHEQRWPKEPSITAGAVLLLDDLSISYLRHIDALDKLEAAGFEAHVSEREIQEADALLEMEALGEEIDSIIERVRAQLSTAIDEGRVIVGAQLDEELRSDPNNAILFMAGMVDALVSDDRYINQYPKLQSDEGRGESAIWTTLDLLHAMVATDELCASELKQLRTLLRRFGYALIPNDDEELFELVAEAPVAGGALVETAELRAWRENLALIQMRGWLAIPTEAEWLALLGRVIAAAILKQWPADMSPEEASARSEWLYQSIDMRNWAGAAGYPNGASLAASGQVLIAVEIIDGFARLTPEQRPHFERWFETSVIDPLKTAHPESYSQLLSFFRASLSQSGQRQPQ